VDLHSRTFYNLTAALAGCLPAGPGAGEPALGLPSAGPGPGAPASGPPPQQGVPMRRPRKSMQSPVVTSPPQPLLGGGAAPGGAAGPLLTMPDVEEALPSAAKRPRGLGPTSPAHAAPAPAPSAGLSDLAPGVLHAILLELASADIGLIRTALHVGGHRPYPHGAPRRR
jgi:hypothetical protein